MIWPSKWRHLKGLLDIMALASFRRDDHRPYPTNPLFATEPQRQYLNEYAGYIQQLSQGKAGKLHHFENEKPLTIRRRLAVTAQMLGITLTIKRPIEDIY